MKKVNVFIIAIVLMVVSVFGSVSSVSATEENNFKVVSGLAISETEIMIDNNIYSGFSDLEINNYYRCACFVDSDNIDIFDIDTWYNYLLDINDYPHDLSRVAICKAINSSDLIDNSGDIWSISDNTLIQDNLYYVFFDKNNTDNYIYDDKIIYIADISFFDVEIYELNKMCCEDINTNTDNIYNLYVDNMLLSSDNIDTINFKANFLNKCFNANTSVKLASNIYPNTAVITCIDNNVCYAIDVNKNIWSFVADDLEVNDIIAMIIDSNNTPTKSDDIILDIRYSGNIDTIRPY